MIRITIAASLLLSSASASWACYEPSVYLSMPTAPSSLSKPDVPYCLQGFGYSGTHSCDDWEITSYQNEVEEYVHDLQDYMNEAIEVARKATAFAQEAEEYARCEAEEVASQHK